MTQFDFFSGSESVSNETNFSNALPKPFVKWVGGKSQLIHEISERLPLDFDSYTTYIEPFIGGGAFLFWIIMHYPNLKKIIINDANKDLINTYTVIRDNPHKFIESLMKLQLRYQSCLNEDEKRNLFYEIREKFNSESTSNLEQATYFIFLNKTCFNGLFRVNSKGKFNVPFGRYSNPLICNDVLILADSLALKKVTILNSDFEEAISYADSKTLIYFDPPYRPLSATSSFCSYCEGGFDDNEQKRLASVCRRLDSKGVKWILSNSDPKGKCPTDTFFDDLYEGFQIKTVSAKRMLNSNPQKRGKLSELLISNY